ncbi:hypothetical protein [Burkholderia mayonis]|uniref:hypothetical protein n=1 Tax=Burkholderia mayonis TaxID=1385591 RepID=UPI000B24DDB4|nr:hypothetical protein [Burkholderia mayonis]
MESYEKHLLKKAQLEEERARENRKTIRSTISEIEECAEIFEFMQEGTLSRTIKNQKFEKKNILTQAQFKSGPASSQGAYG